jgi:hypothetical protein
VKPGPRALITVASAASNRSSEMDLGLAT